MMMAATTRMTNTTPNNEGQDNLPEGFTAVFSMHDGVALRDQVHILYAYRDLIVA